MRKATKAALMQEPLPDTATDAPRDAAAAGPALPPNAELPSYRNNLKTLP